jgi:hypothetical protein
LKHLRRTSKLRRKRNGNVFRDREAMLREIDYVLNSCYTAWLCI